MSEASGLDSRAVLRSFQRRWKFIVICALVGLLAGTVAALRSRHYTAVSRIQVRPGEANQYKVDKSDLLSMGDDSTKLETEVLIVQSDSLLLKVAKKMGLEQNPDFMGSLKYRTDPDSPKAQEWLLKTLHDNISASHTPKTEVIEITCNSRSAALSARVVNTLVAEYIEQIFENRFSSTQRVSKWLSGQLGDLKDQVEADQEKLIQLQSRLGIIGLDQNHDIVVSELEDLTKAADEARIQRIVAEARYRILSSGDTNLLEGGQDILDRSAPSNSSMALLANLRNQRAQIQTKYAGLVQEFGPKYPEVLETRAQLESLNREIQQEQDRVLNQAKEAYTAASFNEKNTNATLEDKKSDAFHKQSDMVQYQILLHDYESSRTLYEGLMERLRQAGIVSGLDSSEVDVIDMARIPGKTSEISRVATVILGLLCGLMLGLPGALLLNQFDGRLRDLTLIESEMGIPLLAIIPRLGKDETVGPSKGQPGAIEHLPQLFLEKPKSFFVEAMWSLRESLLLSNPGRPPKVIVITSSNPGEGKSTIASGQACALALRGARVILVEGELRKPTIARRFGLKRDIGLSSILTGGARLEDAIQSVPSIPNLSVITSGPIPPSPPLILGSDNMAKLMATLSANYDFVVIDSPPVLGMADSPILVQYAEAIVFVMSYPRLNRAQIQRARKILLHVGREITGTALNFADPASLTEYGEGYGLYYGEVPEAKS